MDESIMWWLVWTGIALVIAQLVLYRFQRKSNSWKNLPPGPKPKPVVGNLGDMDALSHQKFTKLSSKYGPLIHMSLGSVPFIVANNTELAKEILKTKDKIFGSRCNTTVFRELAYDHNTVSTSPLGPRWRTLRKIFVGELLPSKRTEEFRGVRKDEATTLLKVLLDESQGGKPAQIGVRLKDHIGNVLTTLIMNKKFFGPHADDALDSTKFQSMLLKVTDLLGVFHLGDYFPLLKGWDIQGNKKKMREVHSEMDVFLQAQIDERRQKLKQGERHEAKTDFLDVLLTRSGENDEYPMTEVNFKGIMQDCILGGIESTASSIEWTLAELIKNPEKLGKAQEELDRVVGRERLFEESDMDNLPYIHAAIKESFRLHPVTPLLVPHCSTEDSEVGGFHVPANSQVCVNVWAIGRDPHLWENPSEFSPERFLGSPIDSSGRYYELLPFGSGRRQCPGNTFGIAVVQTFLSIILQGCLFTALPNQTFESMDMTEGTGLVNHKASLLEATLAPRLPQHVISAPGVL